jgi:hypothetical protein
MGNQELKYIIWSEQNGFFETIIQDDISKISEELFEEYVLPSVSIKFYVYSNDNSNNYIFLLFRNIEENDLQAHIVLNKKNEKYSLMLLHNYLNNLKNDYDYNSSDDEYKKAILSFTKVFKEKFSDIEFFI